MRLVFICQKHDSWSSSSLCVFVCLCAFLYACVSSCPWSSTLLAAASLLPDRPATSDPVSVQEWLGQLALSQHYNSHLPCLEVVADWKEEDWREVSFVKRLCLLHLCTVYHTDSIQVVTFEHYKRSRLALTISRLSSHHWENFFEIALNKLN